MASASPSAVRIASCFTPSAESIAACFSPSAMAIAASREPSASNTTALRVLSAFICSCMASITSTGGSILCISTRTTRTPHLSVASSRTCRSEVLTLSREVRALSRVMSPITFLRLVWASLVTARIKFATL